MSVRWNIKDRKSGQSIMIPGPVLDKERLTLHVILKNCASMGVVRHGDGAHRHKPIDKIVVA